MATTGQITDPELANAFAELSMKKIQAENQIRLSNVQIESLNRKIQHSKLVEQEVASLPQDVHIYKTIGRMFLLQNQGLIIEDLKNKQQSFTDKIKTLESSKEYHQRNVEEFKNNVRELVMTKQNHP
ncbi:prefoldin subunit 1 [Biomphalaria glabrata]|uniref:Prefoldin subunit 1-like n=1 Tax=Biomphalaria glabrata TaxID=6526 RepID=A0A2C9KX23_BIOGL|nr:prefoldin subunit 1-like [Biomphalaria glabrata]KAI8765040.1 prefoldin subunit 1-like [Biomphalaria glabrata]KAI8796991.1 prefoldin subunit 1 [Biomphalaria glabrata]